VIVAFFYRVSSVDDIKSFQTPMVLIDQGRFDLFSGKRRKQLSVQLVPRRVI
jgi:hypothetical protein